MGFFDSQSPEQRTEDTLAEICEQLKKVNDTLEKILEQLSVGSEPSAPAESQNVNPESQV